MNRNKTRKGVNMELTKRKGYIMRNIIRGSIPINVSQNCEAFDMRLAILVYFNLIPSQLQT